MSRGKRELEQKVKEIKSLRQELETAKQECDDLTKNCEHLRMDSGDAAKDIGKAFGTFLTFSKEQPEEYKELFHGKIAKLAESLKDSVSKLPQRVYRGAVQPLICRECRLYCP